MHVSIQSNEVIYADSLTSFPELETFAKLVEKYFPLSEIFVHTNHKFNDGILAKFEFFYDNIDYYDVRLEGIMLGINTYSGKKHFCATPIFPHNFPLKQFFDHESTGEDAEVVFYSLVNGISNETKKLCDCILEGTRMNAKFTDEQKKITSGFDACLYEI